MAKKCKICGKEYKSNSSLATHVNRAHGISIKNYYETYEPKYCQLCGAKLQHKRTIQYLKQDKCPSCGKVKYKYDKSAFNYPYSKKAAYFLGMLVADGSLYRRGYEVSLALDDKSIVKRFQVFLNTTKPIEKRKRKNGNTSYRLRIDRKAFYFQLLSSYLKPRKSYVDVHFPLSWEPQIGSHFLRGYFDGDGGFSYDKSCSNKLKYAHVLGGQIFLTELLYYLAMHTRLHSFNYIGERKGTYEVRWYSTKDILEFGRFIYWDCEDLYLKRKKDRFDFFVESIQNKPYLLEECYVGPRSKIR